MALKTAKLMGLNRSFHVYEQNLRGIISMAVPKGIAERENEKPPKEVNGYGKVGALATNYRS